MDRILERREAPEGGGGAWWRVPPGRLAGWVAGVHTIDGRPASLALNPVARAVGAMAFESWITGHKIPFGDRMARAVDFVKAHGVGFFNGISTVVGGAIDGLTHLLLLIPSLIMIAAISVLACLL